MKSQTRLFNLSLFAGLLLNAVGLWGQPTDGSANEPTLKPEPVTEDEPRRETNDAATELRVGGDSGIRIRVSGRHRPEIVKFGSDAIVREGEESSDVVVIFGSAIIDGSVRGDAVVIGGKAKVNGLVTGNLVVPLGSAELGPNAHIEENAVVIGGTLSASPEARVDGDRVELAWDGGLPSFVGVKNWIMQGLILGRPLPHQSGWWWWVALACALMYLLTALVFARPITAGVGALESQPVGSFFVGVLMFVLFVPLLLLLAVTGVGLVVIPFVFCTAIVAFVFGKIAVYRLVGQQIGKQFGISILQLPIVALLVGIVILYLVYMIPILGFLVWGIIAPLGLGAVTLAAFRAFRSEGRRGNSNPAPRPPAPAAASIPSPAASAVVHPPVIGEPSASLPAGDASLLARAGFWIRFAATFLDLLLVGAFLAVTHLHPIFLIVWVAYHVGMWTWKGTTIGGIVFGIKVIRKDGRDLDFAVALVRSLASFLSALVLFLGFFWAGWNREKLSWHDIIAGTIVVRTPRGSSLL